MQEAQSMVQFVLNYPFPHAASFHHRDGLSTADFPVVGPAAARDVEHRQKTYRLLVARQAQRREGRARFTHDLWEWKGSCCPLGESEWTEGQK